MASRYRALPYDEALAQRVLDRIAGGQMLRDLWRDPTLPTRGDLRRWRQADPAFSRRLREAVNRARSKRMSTYDPATAEAICLRLCLGESLRGVCADRAMPGLMTVFDWRKKHPEFEHALEIAREVQADRLTALGWEIAQSITPQTARAVRVQLAQLRWWVGKLSPKKYGPHKRIDLTAPPAGGQTIEVVTRRFAADGEIEAP